MTSQELREASDEAIEDALNYVDPLVLRGLLYQLTGDESVAAVPTSTVSIGFRGDAPGIVDPGHIAFLRRKAADFLKAHRDAGAGDYPIGPRRPCPPRRPPQHRVRREIPADRLHRSLELTTGEPIAAAEVEMWLEQFALDPMVRGLDWWAKPEAEQKANFLVMVIGAGMGGLNAGVHLKRAGIPFVIVEKNGEVGGTWYENRYPGARVDSLSRVYFHSYGVDFECPGAFCTQAVNERYFNWVADEFDLREDIVFKTEVTSAIWDEGAKIWEVRATGPEGEKVWRANAVISGVGVINRAHMPDIPGMESFAGESFHTSRWPKDLSLEGKRIAVIGSGATGYQTVPELARVAEHVSMFQRTPSWCIEVPGYLSTYPPQVNWLDRNFPWLRNFLRFAMAWQTRPDTLIPTIDIDPDHDDPHSVSAGNQKMRDGCLAFMQRKFGDRPELMEKMLPELPPMTSRPVLVDADYSIYDALLSNHVSLVTEPIERVTPTGIRTTDGQDHAFDIIVYATGFKANDYLFPMTIRGREGQPIEALWAKDGARAYLGAMMPGFPNFFVLLGPNTNPFGSGLSVVDMEEMVTRFALRCIGHLILEGKGAVDVSADAYARFNAELDKRIARKVYDDPRITNYYRNSHGRSAVNNPFDVRLLWDWLRDPVRTSKPATDLDEPIVRPRVGDDLLVD